jgi:hypothetical protein
MDNFENFKIKFEAKIVVVAPVSKNTSNVRVIMIDYFDIALIYSRKMFMNLDIFNALAKTMTHLFKARTILKFFEPNLNRK